jgi:hypothetical protein
MMSDAVTPDYIDHSARVQALMADIEPLASVRRHLRWLAAQHDEVAAQPSAGRPGAPASR